MVRRALSEELASDPELRVVGTSSDGAEALALVMADPPDIVLMDLQMPGVDGFTALRRISAAGLTSRVIVLTNLDDDLTVRRVLAAGGHGCLPKLATFEVLVGAIKLVARAGLAVLPVSAALWLGQRSTAASPFQLTERQVEVLKEISTGRPIREIADSLFVSPSTVKSDLKALEGKLGVRGRVQLATRAQQLGLI